ncbi:MAG: hypothetical protein CVU05_15315 [Bacteroidetes bacterium HGW-Bacteroidetes-21]|nr:MAG: hypothetical protein CVU05_15315 [Bacteroidetes bacterium HGW-Bacteroidetes-21]
MQILNVLSITTIISFICFAVLLNVKNTNHSKANRILSLLFLVYAYAQFHLLLFNTKLIYNYSFLLNLDFIIVTLYSILFYFYVIQMTGSNNTLNKKTLLILSLLLVPIAHLIIFRFIYNSPEKVKLYIDAALIKMPLNATLMNAYLSIINLIFLILSYIRGCLKTIKY